MNRSDMIYPVISSQLKAVGRLNTAKWQCLHFLSPKEQTEQAFCIYAGTCRQGSPLFSATGEFREASEELVKSFGLRNNPALWKMYGPNPCIQTKLLLNSSFENLQHFSYKFYIGIALFSAYSQEALICHWPERFMSPGK